MRSPGLFACLKTYYFFVAFFAAFFGAAFFTAFFAGAFFAAAFFAGAFFAAAFFAGAFFAAAFFVAKVVPLFIGFLVPLLPAAFLGATLPPRGALDFFAADPEIFLAIAFFAETFLATTFLAAFFAT